jgi:hypothetical protein
VDDPEDAKDRRREWIVVGGILLAAAACLVLAWLMGAHLPAN